MDTNSQLPGTLLLVSAVLTTAQGLLYLVLSLLVGLGGLGLGSLALLGVIAEGDLGGALALGLLGGGYGLIVALLVVTSAVWIVSGGFALWAAIRTLRGDRSHLVSGSLVVGIVAAGSTLMFVLGLSPMALVWLVAAVLALLAGLLGSSGGGPSRRIVV